MTNKVKVVICGKDFMLQTAESANYVIGLARTLETVFLRFPVQTPVLPHLQLPLWWLSPHWMT